MNRHFAQILAAATDVQTGRIDRARLFAALETDSRDPIAPIFEAAAFTFDTIEGLKAELPELLAAKFHDLLAQFSTVQNANADRARTASTAAQQACDRLERWAQDFAQRNRALTEQELATIREVAAKTLNESGVAARNAQEVIRRSVADLEFSQEKLQSGWEQVRFRAEDSAAALDRMGFLALLAWLAIAFGAGLAIGGKLF